MRYIKEEVYELRQFIFFIFLPSGEIDSKTAIVIKIMFTFFMKVHFGSLINI